MTVDLVPLHVDGNAEELAAQVAHGFGGDAALPQALFEQTAAMHAARPRPAPWGSYIAFRDGGAVGLGAFKSAPDDQGEVEIAYMTFPAYEGRGHATAIAAALTEIAIGAGSALVIAHTLPVENASNRALRRNGFAFAGDVVDPEDGPVWRWEKRP